jgi:hypothetical protein
MPAYPGAFLNSASPGVRTQIRHFGRGATIMGPIRVQLNQAAIASTARGRHDEV